MDKKLTFLGATGFVVLYFVAVFAAEFIGFAHPVCWMLAPALGAFLGALPYRWLSLRWHKFGLGTVLSAVFGLLMMAMGEVDLTCLAVIVGFGVLSDLVRMVVKRDGITYPILALGNIAEIINLWIRKAWYLQGAAEDGAGLCRRYGSAAELAVVCCRLGGYRCLCRVRTVDSKEINQITM